MQNARDKVSVLKGTICPGWTRRGFFNERVGERGGVDRRSRADFIEREGIFQVDAVLGKVLCPTGSCRGRATRVFERLIFGVEVVEEKLSIRFWNDKNQIPKKKIDFDFSV